MEIGRTDYVFMGGQPRRRKLLCHNWVRKVPPQKSTHNKASGFSRKKNIEAQHIKHCAFFSHLYILYNKQG